MVLVLFLHWSWSQYVVGYVDDVVGVAIGGNFLDIFSVVGSVYVVVVAGGGGGIAVVVVVMLRMLVMMLVLLLVMVLVLACDRHVPDKRGRAAAPQCVSGQREGCRGEEGIGEQRYYLYCNHRQLAHNVRTMPKYKPLQSLAQKVSSMCTKQRPDSSLQTASAQIQNLARKITMYTHSHKFCVHQLEQGIAHIYRVYSPGTPAGTYIVHTA